MARFNSSTREKAISAWGEAAVFAACLWFAAYSLSPHPTETSGGAKEGWVIQGVAQRNGLF